MPTIETLLHRRSDLSTFLVHFTRDSEDGTTSRENLKSILKGRVLEARKVYGMASTLASKHAEIADTQKAVCFTETPLEHAWMMCSDIEKRQVRFDGYGIAFTKTYARRSGVNPVWYLDITREEYGFRDWLTNPVNRMVNDLESIIQNVGPSEAARADILRLTPFMEQMGPMNNGGQKEFWWEREWRKVGSFLFQPRHIVVVFAPESEHTELGEFVARRYEDEKIPRFVDATWGLERMIAALAEVDEPGPFPS